MQDKKELNENSRAIWFNSCKKVTLSSSNVEVKTTYIRSTKEWFVRVNFVVVNFLLQNIKYFNLLPLDNWRFQSKFLFSCPLQQSFYLHGED